MRVGKIIPNYFSSGRINNVSKDTYWKYWLTIGLTKNYPDEESKISYSLLEDKLNFNSQTIGLKSNPIKGLF
jgi:hypothetical protein